MNIQALMRQAQALQKEMLKTKSEIDAKEFEYTSSIVKVKCNGKKEVLSIKIDNSDFSTEDIEVLEDLIMVALNGVFKEIDQYTESKMAKYSNMAGLF